MGDHHIHREDVRKIWKECQEESFWYRGTLVKFLRDTHTLFANFVTVADRQTTKSLWWLTVWNHTKWLALTWSSVCITQAFCSRGSGAGLIHQCLVCFAVCLHSLQLTLICGAECAKSFTNGTIFIIIAIWRLHQCLLHSYSIIPLLYGHWLCIFFFSYSEFSE